MYRTIKTAFRGKYMKKQSIPKLFKLTYSFVSGKIIAILFFLLISGAAFGDVRKITDDEYNSMRNVWNEIRDKCGLNDWRSFFGWDFPVSDLGIYDYGSVGACGNADAAGCYVNGKDSLYVRDDYVFTSENEKRLSELREIVKNGNINNNVLYEYYRLLNKKSVIIHELMHAYSYDKYPMEIDESILNHRCLNEGFATAMTFFAIYDDLQIIANSISPARTPEDLYKETLNDDYQTAFDGFIYAVELRNGAPVTVDKAKKMLDDFHEDETMFSALANGLREYFEENTENIENSKWYQEELEQKNSQNNKNGEDSFTDDGEKTGEYEDGDNVVAEETGSNTENTTNGDMVTSDGNPSSDSNIENADAVTGDGGPSSGDGIPSGDDTGAPDGNGTSGNANDSQSGDVDWSGVGDLINSALDEAAIVGPTIPHKRILWIFSGESLVDSIGDNIKGAFESLRESRVYQNQESNIESLKGSLP